MCCRSQTLHLPVLSAHANHPQEQSQIDITHTPAHPPTHMRLFSHFHRVGAVSSPTRSKPVTWADSTTGQRKTSLSSVNARHHSDDEAFSSLERHTHTTTRNTQHTTQHTTPHHTTHTQSTHKHDTEKQDGDRHKERKTHRHRDRLEAKVRASTRCETTSPRVDSLMTAQDVRRQALT